MCVVSILFPHPSSAHHCAMAGSRANPFLSHLDDPVLAALDVLTEPLWPLVLQTLVEDLLKRVYRIVHLLHRQTLE